MKNLKEVLKKKELKYTTSISLEQGIEKTIEYIRNRGDLNIILI